MRGTVYRVVNHFFGETINVAGLITGQDLIAQLKGKDLGERLLIPANMLRSGEQVFLDDVTVAQAEAALGEALPSLERAAGAVTAAAGYDYPVRSALAWEDYPTREMLREDVALGRGYALLAEGRVAGYLCLDFGGDPAYLGIDGAWGTEEPYGVVHRMAFGAEFQGKGLFPPALRLVEAACLARGVRSLRMDTDPSNLRMQHLLEIW